MPRPKKSVDTVTETPEIRGTGVEIVSPRLDDETWDYIQGRLWDALRLSVLSRTGLDRDLEVYNKLYEGKTPEGKDWPWAGASNLHVPLTQELLDATHARAAKAALANPLVLVVPKDSGSVEIAAKAERYYDAWARKAQVDKEISTAILLALRDGVGLLKVGWEVRKRRVRVRKYVPLLNEDGTPVIDPLNGEPVRQETIETLDLVEYDDVRVVPVELKDFYLIPAHAYSIDRFGSGAAKGVAHRIWLRWDEIKRRADAGQYKQEAVEYLRNNAATERTPDEDVILGGKVAITQPFVVESPQGEVRADKEFELFEVYMSWDLNGDGYEEECKFTIAFKWGILLEATIFPYWHQKRPFIAFIPWPRPRRFYGFAIPERLESLQRELNTIRNQRVDAITINLAPPILVNRGSAIREGGQVSWGPGARLEVDSPEDIAPVRMPEINPSAWTEENILRQEAERVVGFYDINTPRGTGARRTQAEIGAIQQESLIRFDLMMKNIRRSIVDLFEMVHALKIQYMPEQEIFEVPVPATTGDIPQRVAITRAELAQANIEFRANGDLPITDREQARQEAYFLYQALMGHPLVQASLLHQWNLAKVLLEAWDRRDIESIIGTKEEALQLQQAMQQQQQQQPPLEEGSANAPRKTRRTRAAS